MTDGYGYVSQRWTRSGVGSFDSLEVEVSVTRSDGPLTSAQIAAFEGVSEAVGRYFNLLVEAEGGSGEEPPLSEPARWEQVDTITKGREDS